MISISLCMIVKNEEHILGRCLDCVNDWADEVIIVDTGSTDRTKDIAKQYTTKVYDFPWINDYSAARNYSLSLAAMDYCMWLDADDFIAKEDLEELKKLKTTLAPTVDIVMMKYHTIFSKSKKPAISYFRERLIVNHKGYYFESSIYEAISPRGSILYSNIDVVRKKIDLSDPNRSLSIAQDMLQHGMVLDPRQQFYYARELCSYQKYEEAKKVFLDFLNSGKGWVENQIEGCHQLAFCNYALHEDGLALQALLRSLQFDEPRAEICCDIGKHFFDRKQYKHAIFWYELALSRKCNNHSGGFILPDCYDYIPYLHLYLCYDKLGETQHAKSYKNKIELIIPNSKAYSYNKD